MVIKKQKTLLLILSGFFVWTMFSCKTNTPDKKSLGYRIIESSKTIEDTASYSIILEYPVFIADHDTNKNVETLNQEIEGFLDTAANYYWGVTPDSAKQLLDETGSAGKFVLNNSYTLLDTTARFISLKMETYSYALGAHGFTAIHTYNFDVRTGQFIRFNEVINLEDSSNMARLNDLLKKYFENPEGCFNDVPTANGSFKLFGIEPGNMVFYYEAYELGAYYCGMATVKVPVDELRDAGLFREETEYLFTR